MHGNIQQEPLMQIQNFENPVKSQSNHHKKSHLSAQVFSTQG